MEKHKYVLFFFFSVVVLFLGLVSFISCMIAESKKAKKEDVKLDNKLCYLPESRALGFGIAAMAGFIVAQTIGSLVICCDFCLTKDGNPNTCKAKKPKSATALLMFSWMSFGVAVILLSTATSMSRKQEYGKGWLEAECYVVKDGVYIGSGILVLISTAATLGSAIFSIRKRLGGEQATRKHAQVG